MAFFKYYNFFVSSFTALFGLENVGATKILLPLGISFYSFQAVAYVIDVWRGEKAERDFTTLALYIVFFPKLLAGPIAQTAVFLPQLREARRISLDGLSVGLQIFLIGAFKKLVMADNLCVFVDCIYETPTVYSGFTVVLAIITYWMQIYFDFSGYSDMAVGVAKILGYDLPRNFNLPYIAKNPTEIWKRWHITLSNWLMNYLYFSLGGNRKGNLRTYVNLMITMLIGGLWHGANWTFIVWGALGGLGLCVHKFFKTKGWTRYIPAFAAIVLYQAFLAISWVFFRAQTFGDAFCILKCACNWTTPGIYHPYIWSFIAFAVLVAASIVAVLRTRSLERAGLNTDAKGRPLGVQGFYPIVNLGKFWGIFFVTLVFFTILAFARLDTSPFVYAQF
ncbi:MAG: MBOAT family protein [Thermoguttaceae bacterium]|nr:MBOAT family protein [Thermoguttaceae bacterium]